VNAFFRIKGFLLKEQLWVIWCYYRRFRFALVDAGLCLVAFFQNPYRTCRRFSGTHSYGETPLSTFATLAKLANLQPQDRFMDLGSGRGKLCFWSALWLGCQAIGVEQVPSFVRQARWLAKIFRVPVRFDLGRMEEMDLSSASVVYLYAMEWDETVLQRMAQGARLISVGEPVDEGFEILHTVRAVYPWGETEVYIQRRSVLHNLR